MSEQYDALIRLPWVSYLKKARKCDGIKWSTVAMKDIYPYGPNGSIPARGIQDKSRCKKPAHWRFKALKNSTAHSGVYCNIHIYYQGVGSNMEEEERCIKWEARHGRE